MNQDIDDPAWDTASETILSDDSDSFSEADLEDQEDFYGGLRSFGNTRPEDGGWEQVPPSLSLVENLKSLWELGNGFAEQSMAAEKVKALTEEATEKLRETVTSQRQFRYHGNPMGYLSRVFAICDAGNVEELELGECILRNPTDLDGLVSFIQSNPIKKLFLTGNSLTPQGSVRILEALLFSSTIEMIQLGETSVSDDMIPTLARLVLLNTTITNIDLNYYAFQRDLTPLVGALAASRSLLKFTMYDCQLTPAAIASLCQIIRDNKSIEYFDVGGLQGVSPADIASLYESFRWNHTIRFFFADGTSSMTAAADKLLINAALKTALTRNRCLLWHPDYEVYQDTFARQRWARDLLFENYIHTFNRDNACALALNVARKLMMLAELPIELKRHAVDLIIRDHIVLDFQPIISSLFDRQFVGVCRYVFPDQDFSARLLILAAYFKKPLSVGR
ncbi:hypothetical protein HDU91_006150 [Kappamyces sp. JEL0680]|nr:hypothetical protein HDU91_006150 [Kappamyces sp. JEL0680]